MSANYITPGQAYDHFLNPKMGWNQLYSLTVHGSLSSNVDLDVVVPNSGLIVHIASLGTNPNVVRSGRGPLIPTFEMGCAGSANAPIWLFPGGYDPDISNKGTPTGVVSVGTSSYPPNWVSGLPGRDVSASTQLWGFFGTQPLEVETTEFDTAQTYASGQFLRCVTLNDDVDAGKVTNQNASSGGGAFATTGACVWGTDTIVGLVGLGEYYNANDRNVLSVFTYFVPGTR